MVHNSIQRKALQLTTTAITAVLQTCNCGDRA